MVGTALANIIILVANFAAGLLAARYLKAEGRGQYALVLLFPQLLATVGLLGFERSIAILFGQGRLQKPVRVLLRLTIVTSVPSIAVAAAAVTVGVDDPNLRRLGYLLVLYVPAHQLFTLSVSGLMGSGSFRRYNVTRLTLNILYLTFVGVGLLYRPGQLELFVLAYLCAAYIGAAVGFIGFANDARERTEFQSADSVSGVRLAAYNLPFVLPSLVYTFATRVDQLILAIWLPYRDLGLFVVYLSFSYIIAPLANAVNANMFHRSIALTEGHDPLRLCRLAQVVYLSALIPMAVLASFLIGLFFGPSFSTDVDAARLLFVSSFFLFSSQILNEHLKGQRSTTPDLIANGAYMVVVLATGAVLVQFWRLPGMAAAVVLGNFVRYCVISGVYMRRANAHWVDLIPRPSDIRILVHVVLSYIRKSNGTN